MGGWVGGKGGTGMVCVEGGMRGEVWCVVARCV